MYNPFKKHYSLENLEAMFEVTGGSLEGFLANVSMTVGSRINEANADMDRASKNIEQAIAPARAKLLTQPSLRTSTTFFSHLQICYT